MNEKRKRIFKIIVFALIVLLLLLGTVLATLWVLNLRDPDKLAAFQEAIGSLGPLGFFVLLLIQYIQIVIAFIPGGPIQIAAGALYGPLGGLLVCLIGTLLASATVFTLVRKLGPRVISLFVDDKDMKTYSFLQNEKRVETLVMILFFIPGTPKDALTYVFALTAIPATRFLVLATLARLPAMVTSVFAGDQVIQGNWLQAGILFAAITLVGGIGILFHRQILRHYNRKASK